MLKFNVRNDYFSTNYCLVENKRGLLLSRSFSVIWEITNVSRNGTCNKKKLDKVISNWYNKE